MPGYWKNFPMRTSPRSLLLSALLFATAAAHAADPGTWQELFNGKNLDGWIVRGQAQYAVEDGCIVGTTVLNAGNSFLCTRDFYGDFVLEYDFKVDPALNSGVQFRSEVFNEARTLDVKNAKGEVIKVPKDRVHGYQCEIDLDPIRRRWWTAGIYDEARRDWLYPGALGGDGKAFTDQGEKIVKPDDWNHVRIEAVGTSLKTFLNGEPRAAIEDGLTRSGFIALQVHSIGNDASKVGLKARFRGVRLQTVAATPAATSTALNTLSDEERRAGWRLLWDGKTTEGWRSAKGERFPEKGWQIKDGTLTVQPSGGAESANGGDIVTREKFKDFELTADFKITPGANSGIKYYVDPDLNKGAGSAIGLEYQILDDERHPDAKLGRDGNRTLGSLYDLIPADTGKQPNPIGEWNTARIVSRGHQVEHWLNGRKVLAYERGSKKFRDLVARSKYAKWSDFGELPEGPILLQDHGNEVAFRNVKIRTLAAQ